MLDWSFQRPADIRLRFRYNLNFVLYFSFDTTLPPRSMENDLIAWFKSCPFFFKLFLFCFFFLCMCCALGFAFVFWALGIDGMDLFFDIWDFIHMGWYQIRLAYCLDISDLAVKPCFWHWIIFFPYSCFIIIITTTIIETYWCHYKKASLVDSTLLNIKFHWFDFLGLVSSHSSTPLMAHCSTLRRSIHIAACSSAQASNSAGMKKIFSSKKF